ncbi:hypothetical protein ABNF97_25830 [Plantactinospora sp. B6F1]|uniref:hypothetical protein n=1 Tax=Plantactinospora sp. B6F1 TaxID=3158971 RepID=UPI00102B94E1
MPSPTTPTVVPPDPGTDGWACDFVTLRQARRKLGVLAALTAVALSTGVSPWLSAGLLALTVLIPVALVGHGGWQMLPALVAGARDTWKPLCREQQRTDVDRTGEGDET